MISETSFAVASVVEAEGYDHGVGDDWGELGLSLVSKCLAVNTFMKREGYGGSHAPAFQISGQAVDVIVFAADNVAVGVEGFPFKAASVMTQAFYFG